MTTPHLVQYQGSKRLLAPEILKYFPKHINRLIEPFSGTAAISIASAQHRLADKFIINDINRPLINLLELCVNDPESLYMQYKSIWEGQFKPQENNVDYFYKMRDQFNETKDPVLLLFMLARVVKGAIRYNSKGELNQSCDKRRYGTKPDLIKLNAYRISNLLKGKVEFYSMDYKEILKIAEPGDLIYMDPPYQGTSNTRDDRYLSGIDFQEFVQSLEDLNSRGINYIISYDGLTGNKKHGFDLPDHLRLTHILINAGKSAQSTLLGKNETTYESLYISEGLEECYKNAYYQLEISF